MEHPIPGEIEVAYLDLEDGVIVCRVGFYEGEPLYAASRITDDQIIRLRDAWNYIVERPHPAVEKWGGVS